MAAAKKKTATRKRSGSTKKKLSEVTCEAELVEAAGSAGRRTGSKNKIPLAVRQILSDYLGDELPYLMSRRDEMELKDRWDIVKSLLPYVTPKMISNDINANLEVDSVTKQLSELAAESVRVQIN